MRRGALYLAAALCVATGSSASAQMTRPFEVLEGARRDRIEADKRMPREAAEQRRKEKERATDYAKQEAAKNKPAGQDSTGTAKKSNRTPRP